ncbi:uncharacterized protein LOC114933805 [Nylanderia fulva]|uniref:uncharacterized protein LOC114933805 n=1 Tax=Nylanderia fulva TaxID=613905 RepID=UPI0010FB4671|nr:uncharacterized protein LOC114933805 [Nylanderia fulva]
MLQNQNQKEILDLKTRLINYSKKLKTLHNKRLLKLTMSQLLLKKKIIYHYILQKRMILNIAVYKDLNIFKDIRNILRSEELLASTSAGSLLTFEAATKNKSCQKDCSSQDETCTQQNVELSTNDNLIDKEERSNSNRNTLTAQQNDTSSSEDLTENEDEEEMYSERSKDELEFKIDNLYQLYGKEWDEKMVLLDKRSKIYCIRRILIMTIFSASKVTSVVRRLMDGVFNPEQITNFTFTGQAPRAQGKERQHKQYDCFDSKTVKAIIDYAKSFGTRQNWKIPSNTEIKRALSAKLRSTQLKQRD